MKRSIYAVILALSVIMGSPPAIACPDGQKPGGGGKCQCYNEENGQYEKCSGWDWGGVATVLGVALVLHILAGDDSPWAYSPAPVDPDAPKTGIDWGFNATPDVTTVTLDIPFDF